MQLSSSPRIPRLRLSASHANIFPFVHSLQTSACPLKSPSLGHPALHCYLLWDPGTNLESASPRICFRGALPQGPLATVLTKRHLIKAPARSSLLWDTHPFKFRGHNHLNYNLKWHNIAAPPKQRVNRFNLNLSSSIFIGCWPWPSSLVWASVFLPLKWEDTTKPTKFEF